MIPIKKTNNVFTKYKNMIINHINNKRNGSNRIQKINNTLESIAHNLTLDTLILMDCDDLKYLKRRYSKYYRELSNLDKKKSF